ncbi:hypothetical protein [Nitrincola sp.]|uniref:hypothetical protein n=1 Tax=Nitrincola sp. TaxID=1926584 RepID=UPI003A90AF0B
MNDYRHHVSGFFALRVEAENAVSKLVDKGLSREQMHIYSADSNSPSPAPEGKSDATLKNILVDGAVGTAVGTGAGVLGSVALAATSVTLFVASPVVAPLVLIGWGASLGGLIGTAVGSADDSGKKKEGTLSDLIGDAIANGHVALVVETRTEQETAMASEVIKDSVGECKDTDDKLHNEPIS